MNRISGVAVISGVGVSVIVGVLVAGSLPVGGIAVMVDVAGWLDGVGERTIGAAEQPASRIARNAICTIFFILFALVRI